MGGKIIENNFRLKAFASPQYKLEDVKGILIDNLKDEKFFLMVVKDACVQMKMIGHVTVSLDNMDFPGIKGKLVSYKISSGYNNRLKLDATFKRIFERLYKTKSTHNIYALLENETKPVKFELLLAEWDIDKLRSIDKSL